MLPCVRFGQIVIDPGPGSKSGSREHWRSDA